MLRLPCARRATGLRAPAGSRTSRSRRRGEADTVAVAFDTHAAVTALRKAGFDEPQAEAAVAMVRDAVTEGVATKADIDRLETKMEALEAKIEALETKIDAGLSALKWVAGIVVALVAAIAARQFGAI